jgi:hypothetical protein
LPIDGCGSVKKSLIVVVPLPELRVIPIALSAEPSYVQVTDGNALPTAFRLRRNDVEDQAAVLVIHGVSIPAKITSAAVAWFEVTQNGHARSQARFRLLRAAMVPTVNFALGEVIDFSPGRHGRYNEPSMYHKG